MHPNSRNQNQLKAITQGAYMGKVRQAVVKPLHRQTLGCLFAQLPQAFGRFYGQYVPTTGGQGSRIAPAAGTNIQGKAGLLWQVSQPVVVNILKAQALVLLKEALGITTINI